MQPQEVGAGEILANLSVAHIVLAALVLTVIRLALTPIKVPFARSIAELIESLLVAGVLVFLIIRPFFMQAFYIPSESMEPTLMGHEAGYNHLTGESPPTAIHDKLFVNKLIYRLRDPKREDIVVFRAPAVADMMAEPEHRAPVENVLIKRLIGIPGDTIQVKPDDKGVVRVFRNGKPVDEPVCNGKDSNEPCIKEPMDPTPSASYAVDKPLKLGPDELFVMGDNRNHSNDSRFWGPLKRDRVIGKASFIFWPLDRIRILR
jgi:signal peptidase I